MSVSPRIVSVRGEHAERRHRGQDREGAALCFFPFSKKVL